VVGGTDVGVSSSCISLVAVGGVFPAVGSSTEGVFSAVGSSTVGAQPARKLKINTVGIRSFQFMFISYLVSINCTDGYTSTNNDIDGR
jgi:hypothetical protein